MHYPPLWKFRLLRRLDAKGNRQNRRLLAAWARAEGGTARNNPLNTTQPWPHATDYNSAGVKNYVSGGDGLDATCKTLLNGRYNGIVADLRAGRKDARSICRDNGKELDVWGTGGAHVQRLL